MVVKRDGSHEPFSRENVMRGVVAACGKRPIPEATKSKIVDAVEDELHREFDREVESRVIGERGDAEVAGCGRGGVHPICERVLPVPELWIFKAQMALLDAHVKDVKDQQKLF